MTTNPINPDNVQSFIRNLSGFTASSVLTKLEAGPPPASLRIVVETVLKDISETIDPSWLDAYGDATIRLCAAVFGFNTGCDGHSYFFTRPIDDDTTDEAFDNRFTRPIDDDTTDEAFDNRYPDSPFDD